MAAAGNSIIRVKIIRHAHSIANKYKDKHHKLATEEKYRDPRLSDKGILSIETERNKIQKKLGHPELFLCSPLLRTTETLLRIYQDIKLPKKLPIKIFPLVCEIGNIIENKGSSREDIKKKILKFPNSNLFDSDDLSYYDYGWKKSKGAGKSWKDLEGDVLHNKDNIRFPLFQHFLDITMYKDIVIVSHHMFIEMLYKYICTSNKKVPKKIKIDNLDGISFTYNKDTQEFNDVKKISDNSMLEKYLKYKRKYCALRDSISNTIGTN